MHGLIKYIKTEIKMKSKIKIKEKSTVEKVLVVDPEDLKAALLDYFQYRLDDDEIGEYAEFYFEVPGGGDYSNCELTVDESPLKIRWFASK